MNDFDGAYHLISTDNDYMAQIGLAAFTSGQLAEWWNRTDERNSGIFVNRNLIQTSVLSDGSFDAFRNVIFGSPAINMGIWSAQDSVFGIQNINSPSTFTLQGKDAPITTSSINQDDLIDWHVVKIVDQKVTVQAVDNNNVLGYACRLINSTIEHNNLIRLKYINEGGVVSKWQNGISYVDSDGNSVTAGRSSILSLQDILNKATYINAIKASQDRGLTWTVTIPFVLNLNSLGTCVTGIPVKFKLQLFDHNVLRTAKKGISFFNGNQPIVGTPHNMLGQRGLSDRGSMLPPKDVAANLDMHYDEHVGKFRAGTKQMLGTICETIPPYANSDVSAEDIDAADETKVVTLIKKNKIPQGEAFPLLSQNGNINIWAFPFEQPASCRTKPDKMRVKVLNFASKEFVKNTRVLLTNIVGSYWVCQDFGIPAPTVPSYDIGKNWKFNYLMMNSDNYFRKFDVDQTIIPTALVQFSPDSYENAFYSAYYDGLSKYASSLTPPNAELSLDASLNSPTETPPFLTNTSDPIIHVTSFDYLGKHAGGTMASDPADTTKRHGIACVNFSFDTAGGSLGGTDGKFKDGFVSQFFGCVFPAGYVVVDPATKFNTDAQKWMSFNDYRGPSSYFDTMYIRDTDGGVSTVNPPLAPGFGKNKNGDPFDPATASVGYYHLPADIALHSEATPITKVKNLVQQHSLIADSLSVFTNAKAYMLDKANRNCWIASSGNGSITDAYGGIKPKTRNQLQFRPLCIEQYAAFEANQANSVVRPGGGAVSTSFGSKNRSNTSDKTPTYSQHALFRADVKSDPTALLGSPIRYGAYSQGGTIVPASPETSLGCKYYTGGSQASFPTDVWNSKYGNEPANAVGVITASCEATFNTNSVPVTVTSFIGMVNFGSNFNSSNITMLGIGGFGGGTYDFGGTGGGNTTQYWGVSAGGISRFNTTELWMRVYQYWPMDQTVFDPRYFAVHHYNYGIDKQVDYYQNVGGSWYIKGTKILTTASLNNCGATTPGLPTSFDQLNPATTYGKYGADCVPYYAYSIEVPNADYQIPTWSNASTLINGTIPQDNTPIPVDQILYSDDPVRQQKDWIVEPKLRGKLLPFNYNKRTIGIGHEADNKLLGVVIDPNLPANQQPYPGGVAGSLVIKSNGTGYTSDDTFTTTGGGGTGVQLVAVTGQAGSIVAFNVKSAGEGFAIADFLPWEKTLLEAGPSAVSIKPISVKGKDFTGYITRGQVTTVKKSVSKPITCLSPTQLSPPTAGGNVIDITSSKTVQLENVAPSGRYSVFLHFHNDVSHTMQYSIDYQCKVPCYQQHITVTLG